jgi:transposase
MRHVIGQEIHEQLDFVPAKVTVIEHVRLKYACPECHEKAAETGPQIVTAEKPLAPIEKGLAAPGLLAYIIVSKYGDHLSRRAGTSAGAHPGAPPHRYHSLDDVRLGGTVRRVADGTLQPDGQAGAVLKSDSHR